MQGVASLAPHAHFSPRAACCPKRPPGADGHRPGSIKGLGKNSIAECGLHQRSILHLDALQIRSPEGEMREIETPQVSTKHSQEVDEIRRCIALLFLLPSTQLAE